MMPKRQPPGELELRAFPSDAHPEGSPQVSENALQVRGRIRLQYSGKTNRVDRQMRQWGYVYQNLLPSDRRAEGLARKRYLCSVISFFWGVDQPYEALGPHALFLADDYRANFLRRSVPRLSAAPPSSIRL
jgi:hypothetical protein